MASKSPADESAFLLTRTILRVLLAAFFLIAGVLHLSDPDPFLLITPDWVPLPRLVIGLTGGLEIVAGAGLLFERTKRAAGIALAVYAICVFPANIKHAFEHIAVPGLPGSWWYHGPRLALQPVLVWMALFATDVIGCPFGVSHRTNSRPRDAHPPPRARARRVS